MEKRLPEKLPKNIKAMGVVSFLNDLSSDMIFPFIPLFLTSVLHASLSFVGLVEGVADATASVLKIFSGRLSDTTRQRKPFVVLGYSLSALAKPLLSVATAPWHVLAVRFLDRVGKGTRDAPRDALISFSVRHASYGKAFGFHKAMDTMGAALGPLVAMILLPLLNNNLRSLFLLSCVASFFAVLVIVLFVKEKHPSAPLQSGEGDPVRVRSLGAPFFAFLCVALLFSLGKPSEAFLILRAKDVGIPLLLIPLLYFISNITFAMLAMPFGILGDRVGKRRVFLYGLLLLSLIYAGFSLTQDPQFMWMLFALFGVYSALSEGIGRAIVADLVAPAARGTAFGVFNGLTGIALLPGSLLFGFLAQRFGNTTAFLSSSGIILASALFFMILRSRMKTKQLS